MTATDYVNSNERSSYELSDLVYLSEQTNIFHKTLASDCVSVQYVWLHQISSLSYNHSQNTATVSAHPLEFESISKQQYHPVLNMIKRKTLFDVIFPLRKC